MGVFAGFPNHPPKWASRFDGAHIFETPAFTVYPMFQPTLVISIRPAHQINQNGLLASTVCTLANHRRFMLFYKNSAHPRDWRRLAISWMVLGPIGVTLNRQMGFLRLLSRHDGNSAKRND